MNDKFYESEEFRRGLAPTWQSIETAPERKLILVWQELWGFGLRLYRRGEWWAENENLDDSELAITHWMPLPEPPEE